MKKIIKSRIFLVILTAIIVSSVTVYAVNNWNAGQITYKSTTVDKALDELYLKANSGNKLILTASGWKYASSWGNDGLHHKVAGNDDYITYLSDGNTIKFNKSAKIKITAFMQTLENVSQNPKYKIYKNNTEILSLTNGKTENNSTIDSITIDIDEGTTLYGSMYGGGNGKTYYVTVFELIND